jgi:hypothetical protein
MDSGHLASRKKAAIVSRGKLTKSNVLELPYVLVFWSSANLPSRFSQFPGLPRLFDLTGHGKAFVVGCGNRIPSVMGPIPDADRCQCEPKAENKGRMYPPKGRGSRLRCLE